jgi:hypothetical protein
MTSKMTSNPKGKNASILTEFELADDWSLLLFNAKWANVQLWHILLKLHFDDVTCLVVFLNYNCSWNLFIWCWTTMAHSLNTNGKVHFPFLTKIKIQADRKTSKMKLVFIKWKYTAASSVLKHI